MPHYRSLPFMSYRGKHRAPDPRIVRARQVARAGGGATLIAVLAAALALSASTGTVSGSASRPGTAAHTQAHREYAFAALNSTPAGRLRQAVIPVTATTAPTDLPRARQFLLWRRPALR